MTDPRPSKESWTASPLPLPMSAAAFAVRRTPVRNEVDQATAESVSTKVGWSTSISTGVPWQAMATLPRPSKTVLNRPARRPPPPSNVTLRVQWSS